MKKPWESFEKNYVAVETTDERTGKTRLQYEYCGPWFVCQNGKAALNRAKGGVGAALIVSIVCVLWAGIQPSQLNRAGLTSVPYGLSLAALIFTAFGVGYLLFSGERVKRPEYERMTRLLSFAPVIQGVLLLLSLIAGLFLLINGKARAADAWSLAGYFLGGCAAALIYFVFKALRYREEKNTDFEYEKDFLLGNSKNAKQ